MDASEPSTNGVSASNLYRLSSLLNDQTYATIAKETIQSFEAETLQYPWLFASFMPSIVAGQLGVRGVVVSIANSESKPTPSSSDAKSNSVPTSEYRVEKIKEFEKSPRGGLQSFAKLDSSNTWLRERNPLFKDFGADGKTRIMICENGACHEEREGAGLDLSTVAAALPTDSTASSLLPLSAGVGKGKGKEEEKVNKENGVKEKETD